MKKSIYISLFLSLALLGGCSTVDVTKNKEDLLKSPNTNDKAIIEVVSPATDVTIYFVRQSEILTADQGLWLSVDDKKIGKLQNAGNFETKISSGNYELSTKGVFGLGFSPRSAIFKQGVCQFSKDFNLKNESYYFKVVHVQRKAPAVLGFCGKYEIVEISESEYSALSVD